MDIQEPCGALVSFHPAPGYAQDLSNVPEESSGWTIVLMDRASRFIWEISCGKKDRSLFKKAIKTMVELVDQTEDVTLLTDGERRYGNILFEICHELLRTGKPGRPQRWVQTAEIAFNSTWRPSISQVGMPIWVNQQYIPD